MELSTLFFTLSCYNWSMLRYACMKTNNMSSLDYSLLLLLEDGIRCHLRNTIGCRKRMKTGKRGTAGDPTSANGNGGLCARIIRPAGQPGISCRMTRPARTPTGGAKMACWG